MDHNDARRKDQNLTAIRRHENALSRWVSHFHKNVIQGFKQSAMEIKVAEGQLTGKHNIK